MRNINFRAWRIKDGFDKSQMIYNISILNTLTNSNEDDNLIFMQAIDMKDKNGREIYEGDIVEGHLGYRFEIKYSKNYIEDSLIMGFNLGEREEKLIVIGNIYENQELLPKI